MALLGVRLRGTLSTLFTLVTLSNLLTLDYCLDM